MLLKKSNKKVSLNHKNIWAGSFCWYLCRLGRIIEWNTPLCEQDLIQSWTYNKKFMFCCVEKGNFKPHKLLNPIQTHVLSYVSGGSCLSIFLEISGSVSTQARRYAFVFYLQFCFGCFFKCIYLVIIPDLPLWHLLGISHTLYKRSVR